MRMLAVAFRLAAHSKLASRLTMPQFFLSVSFPYSMPLDPQAAAARCKLLEIEQLPRVFVGEALHMSRIRLSIDGGEAFIERT